MLNNYKDFISYLGYPFSSVGKESACNAGDLGLIPGLGRSPGEGNGNPLQYCCCCCCLVASVVSDSVWTHRQQPTRLPCPWDSPGKNTGVGCHFILQCMKGKSESEVAQSCPTLSDPMDCSLPGSSVYGFSRQGYWRGVPLPSLKMKY